MDLDEEYIAGVVQCELAGLSSSGPALEAQAIAARTYMAKYFERKGAKARLPVGPHFQCWKAPKSAAIEAARYTSGVIVQAQDRIVTGNYVAGARHLKIDCQPDTPRANGYDFDSWEALARHHRTQRKQIGRNAFTGVSWTEIYVTRNEYLEQNDVDGTPMSRRGNTNRGALGQYAAVCLAENLGYETLDILRYFYGDDIRLTGRMEPVGVEGGHQER